MSQDQGSVLSLEPWGPSTHLPYWKQWGSLTGGVSYSPSKGPRAPFLPPPTLTHHGIPACWESENPLKTRMECSAHARPTPAGPHDHHPISRMRHLRPREAAQPEWRPLCFLGPGSLSPSGPGLPWLGESAGASEVKMAPSPLKSGGRDKFL